MCSCACVRVVVAVVAVSKTVRPGMSYQIVHLQCLESHDVNAPLTRTPGLNTFRWWRRCCCWLGVVCICRARHATRRRRTKVYRGHAMDRGAWRTAAATAYGVQIGRASGPDRWKVCDDLVWKKSVCVRVDASVRLRACVSCVQIAPLP